LNVYLSVLLYMCKMVLK